MATPQGIPPTFLSELAEQAPFVIFQNQLYQVAEGNSTVDCLTFGNSKFALVPSSDLRELERFYRERHEEEIFQFKREFIDERLKQEMKSAEDMEKYVTENKTLHFILYKVFPLLIENSEELDDFLQGKVRDNTAMHREIDRALQKGVGKITVTETQIEQLKKELRREYEEEKKEKRAPSARETENLQLEQLLGGPQEPIWILPTQLPEAKPATALTDILQQESVFVFEGKAYRLERTEAHDVLQIAGITFRLAPWQDVQTIEEAYQQQLERQFKWEAVDEFASQIEEIQKIRSRGEAVKKVKDKGEYEINNVGFLKKQDGYRGEQFYVYARLPKFAVQNPLKHEDYHPFPSLRVAVPVNERGTAGDAVLVEKVAHPFISDWNSQYQHICIMSDRQDGSGAQGVERRLSQAANIIMNGLTIDSLRSHHSVSEDAMYFSRKLKECLDKAGRITRKQALAQGYKITVEWREKPTEADREKTERGYGRGGF